MEDGHPVLVAWAKESMRVRLCGRGSGVDHGAWNQHESSLEQLRVPDGESATALGCVVMSVTAQERFHEVF